MATKAGFCLRNSKNLLLRKIGMLRVSSLILVLTDKCNLRCLMCDIWEKKGGKSRELGFDKIRRFLNIDALRHLKYVSLTGGEPFLRQDLYEMVSAINDGFSPSGITISSNGTLTGEIINFLARTQKYKNINLELSLLGIKSHDKVSGIEGSFKDLGNTINEICSGFPSLKLRVKFVITPWNYFEIEEVADYCSGKNIPLIFKIVENVKAYSNSVRYYENLENKKFIFNNEQIKLITDALQRTKASAMVNKILIGNLINILAGEGVNKECLVPFISLFINSSGDIYRCRMDEPIGNINNEPADYFTGIHKNGRDQFRYDSQTCSNCASLLRLLI